MSGPSHLDIVDTPGYLGRILADVELPGVRFAVVGSEDGLAITYSRGTDADVADSVAAAAAALRSLIKAMAQLCGDTEAAARQSISEYDGGLIFIDTAGPGLLLAVAATADADVTLVADRLCEIASRGHRPAATRVVTPAAGCADDAAHHSSACGPCNDRRDTRRRLSGRKRFWSAIS